mmetsp:Transcript_30363/g.60054  ORF Transcript_30363/g.60054 Transcript_30363/m.60054 type:complete len:155 (-) Transcript_30363:39-503(-)
MCLQYLRATDYDTQRMPKKERKKQRDNVCPPLSPFRPLFVRVLAIGCGENGKKSGEVVIASGVDRHAYKKCSFHQVRIKAAHTTEIFVEFFSAAAELQTSAVSKERRRRSVACEKRGKAALFCCSKLKKTLIFGENFGFEANKRALTAKDDQKN